MTASGQYPNARGHKLRNSNKPKRSYPTRLQARKSLVRRILLDMVEMGTYPCTSGDKVHYHFGHSTLQQRWDGWKALQRWRRDRLVKHPYYEAKRRFRYLVTGKIHSGAHIKRG